MDETSSDKVYVLISLIPSYAFKTTGTQPKCTELRNQSSFIKQCLETLFLAIKMCIGFTTDNIWMNVCCFSVTSEPSQGSSRNVSSFQDSSLLLNI